MPGLQNLTCDTFSTIPKTSWYRTLLKGIFNFQSDPTMLQLAVWALYSGPGLYFFFREPPCGPTRPNPPKQSPPPDPEHARRQGPHTSCARPGAGQVVLMPGTGCRSRAVPSDHGVPSASLQSASNRMTTSRVTIGADSCSDRMSSRSRRITTAQPIVRGQGRW